ncbi:MAG: dihydroorotate dehydrogenase electron transfer subunit [Dysgonamonadaceae bacterium]|jgi:dihydroorotate dehydrogenase electron transfer subunit|nr:dihydroorotate dehydrogenase electron transfer subunit [Dysgonamonadaceae bacterium]
MRKYISDWIVKENLSVNDKCCLLKLTVNEAIPEMFPGQFVNIRIDNSVFLRRPISIHFVDRVKNELWLLVQIVGNGTRKLSEAKSGDILNMIYPLGNHFFIPGSEFKNKKLLLVGGGVGIAPLLYLGDFLKEKGLQPTFLLGARSKNDLLQIKEFAKRGEVHVTTENGDFGEKGFVTNHSILTQENIDFIYTCGPKPMMLAVAKYARERAIPCEVSLENTMACGIGACLCCVEKTLKGNACVCTEGPVFNINQLSWQI